MNLDTKKPSETLSRREREKLAHRQEILIAATRVFAQKGFFNATLDEIAHEAEFSKGALYLHFSNKEDLLYSIIEDKVDKYVQIVNKILSGKKSFKVELTDYYKKMAAFSFDEKDFFNLLMTQHTSGFSALSKEKAKKLCAIHDKVNEIVTVRAEKAKENGELRDFPPAAVNGLIHGSVKNMMMTRWSFETVEELHNAVDVFINMIFTGIAKEREGYSDK